MRVHWLVGNRWAEAAVRRCACKAWKALPTFYQENLRAADESIMKAPLAQPIRLTEGQTEMLTKALTDAAKEGARSKSGETQMIKKPMEKSPSPTVKSGKKSLVI